MDAVIHGLNQAFRYADHLIVMKDGCNVAHGPPAQIVTPELLDVFGIGARVVADPETGNP